MKNTKPNWVLTKTVIPLFMTATFLLEAGCSSNMNTKRISIPPEKAREIYGNEESSKDLLLFSVDVSSAGTDFLRLRSKPSTSGEIIGNISDGSVVCSTKADANNMVSDSKHKWIKIHAGSVEGWVASEYLVLRSQQNNHGIDGTEYDFGNEGCLNGVFGVDFADWVNPEGVRTLFATSSSYTDDFPEMNESMPKFAIMRIGATGYGDSFSFIKASQDRVNNMEKIISILNEYGVPFGVYYVSQATTIEEANAEVENILAFCKLLNLLEGDQFMLPLYIDIEDAGGKARITENARKNGKSQQTAIINYIMNKVRDGM